jgi:hypothetical protein
VTDLAKLSVYDRTERIEEVLMEALRHNGFEVGTDRDGRYFLTPSKFNRDEENHNYLHALSREIEREMFP